MKRPGATFPASTVDPAFPTLVICFSMSLIRRFILHPSAFIARFSRPGNNVSRRLRKTRCEGESATGFRFLGKAGIPADALRKFFHISFNNSHLSFSQSPQLARCPEFANE